MSFTISEPINRRPHISRRIREQVLEKYNHRCALCGDTEHLHIDHIISAVESDGVLDIDNLQVLCRACNTSKGPNDTVSPVRQLILDMREKLYAHTSQPSKLSYAAISRITDVKYRTVLGLQYYIRKWIKDKDM